MRRVSRNISVSDQTRPTYRGKQVKQVGVVYELNEEERLKLCEIDGRTNDCYRFVRFTKYVDSERGWEMNNTIEGVNIHNRSTEIEEYLETVEYRHKLDQLIKENKK